MKRVIVYCEGPTEEFFIKHLLLPYLSVHEFEALLFSDPHAFEHCDLNRKDLEQLYRIRAAFRSPEHIDNSPASASSKRILSIFPRYQKVLDGVNIAKRIGIEKMREECHHFDEWLTKIGSFK